MQVSDNSHAQALPEMHAKHEKIMKVCAEIMKKLVQQGRALADTQASKLSARYAYIPISNRRIFRKEFS